MNQPKWLSLFLGILFIFPLLSGCNPAVNNETSTPAATATQEPALPTEAATETATATTGPEPSATPTIAEPTNTAEPTATAVPPTAIATPTTPPATEAASTPASLSVQLLVAIEDEATETHDLYFLGPDGSLTLFASLADLAGSYRYIAGATAVGDLIYLSLVDSGLFSFWTINASGERQALDFIPSEEMNVRQIAVWPDAAGQPSRLAWATNQNGLAQLHSSAADGSEQTVLAEVIQEMDDGVWDIWEVVGWSADGQRVYYSAEPAGAGGLWLFGGYSDLWAYDFATGTTTQLAEAFTCLEPLSPDEQWLPDQCNDTLHLTNLVTGEQREVPFPAEVADPGQFGQVRFRPDSSRFAYAAEWGVANGSSYSNGPETVRGWVVVVDTVTSQSVVVTTSPPRSYFTVEAWLPQDVLVLEGNEMPGYIPSVWIVHVDGTGLVKLADGQFLTWVAMP